MGRIGRSIALGQGFANPYGDSTGPTAWEPPLYPFLIGGVFRVFGIYSPASAWVLLTINSLFTALTSIPIFLIARDMMGERLALVSAWIWALLPYAMYWSIHWIWDTTFSPLLLACVFLRRPPTRTCERTENLGAFRRAVGLARAFERLPAVFSPFLRALGVGSAAPARAAPRAGSWACLHDFLFVPGALAGEECAGFRPFGFYSR